MTCRQLFGIVLVWASFSVAAGCQSTACASHPSDKAAVTETLRTMYRAASASDLAGFDALVAPGFYAYDGGMRLEGDALMKAVMQYEAKGVVFVWNMQDPDVHVFCDHAWIAYVNKGSIQMSASTPAVPTTWLESAELQKIGGTWKLVFFHSTRVEPPQAST